MAGPRPRDAMRDRFRQVAVEFNDAHPDLWADVSYERSNGGVCLVFYRQLHTWRHRGGGQKYEAVGRVTIGLSGDRAYPIVEWHGQTLSEGHQQAIDTVIRSLRGARDHGG